MIGYCCRLLTADTVSPTRVSKFSSKVLSGSKVADPDILTLEMRNCCPGGIPLSDICWVHHLDTELSLASAPSREISHSVNKKTGVLFLTAFTIPPAPSGQPGPDIFRESTVGVMPGLPGAWGRELTRDTQIRPTRARPQVRDVSDISTEQVQVGKPKYLLIKDSGRSRFF